jgi:chemotaxis response regulator CheB
MASNLSIVLVGALAGDVTGLETIAANLPADLPRCFIVLPIRAGAVSHLPRILSAKGPLPAIRACDGDGSNPPGTYLCREAKPVPVARWRLHKCEKRTEGKPLSPVNRCTVSLGGLPSTDHA